MGRLASGFAFGLLSAGLCAPALALDAAVRLPDGQPAADAQVLVLGQTGSARTGPDGRFRWVLEPGRARAGAAGDAHGARIIHEVAEPSE